MDKPAMFADKVKLQDTVSAPQHAQVKCPPTSRQMLTTSHQKENVFTKDWIQMNTGSRASCNNWYSSQWSSSSLAALGTNVEVLCLLPLGRVSAGS
jgi:hypothetical protein